MNVESESTSSRGTHLGMYNFEEKWKHLVPSRQEDIFDAYLQSSPIQKAPAAVDHGHAYFTQVNLMSNSGESMHEPSKIDKKLDEEIAKPQVQQLSLPFKVGIGITIASCVVLAMIVAMSATGNIDVIPNINESGSTNQQSHLFMGDPTTIPTRSPFAKTTKPTATPSRPSKQPIGSKPPVTLCPSAIPSTVSPSAAPTDVSQTWEFSYLHTSGNQIVDRNEDPVRLSAVNWCGFDSSSHIPQGLWVRSYKSILTQMQNMGFNSIRIPFANDMLRNASKTQSISYQENPDLAGLSPLQCLDKIIEFSGSISMRVILSRQSCHSDASNRESHWFVPNDAQCSEAQVNADWVMLARRYLGTAVIGFDLWNTPKGLSTWGTGNLDTDWNSAAERAGNAALSANPYLLIFVQGLQYGNDLTGVAKNPIKLNIPGHVVYTTPEYSNDLHDQPHFSDPTFPYNLRSIWNNRFGFIVIQQIAPIMINEFGVSFAFSSDTPWLTAWMKYLNGEYLEDDQSFLSPGHVGISWSYQQIAPYGPVGGILSDDWYTVQTTKLTYLTPAMGVLFSFVNHSVPFIPPPANKTSVVPNPTYKPTFSPTQYPYEYFHTSGNQIVDRAGKPVRFSGINWAGTESYGMIVQGLWVRNYKSLIYQIRDLGFNTLRIPYSNAMLRDDAVVTGVDYYLNPDLIGLTPLECLILIIDFAGSVGLRIILDRHSCLVNNYNKEALWYLPGDDYYTEERFIKDWVMLAKLFKGTAVLGADLWNEPKMICTWGSGNKTTDWNLAAERVGNAILEVNSDWLLFVEGTGLKTWWGGNLHGVRKHPIVFNVPNRVVYSVHEYCLDVDRISPWFWTPEYPNNLRPRWDWFFGFIFHEQIAPIWIGEYGTEFKFDQTHAWIEMWVNYTNGYFRSDEVNDLPEGHLGMSWALWAVSPGGDVGGILKADWISVEEEKMKIIRKALAPLLPSVTQEYLSRDPSNTSLVVPSPTMSPTSQKKPFQYYHTKGNQIVDSLGNPIRWMGMNWYGIESVWRAPIALWTRNYRSVLEQILALGYNLVRLPFANEVLSNYSKTVDIDFSVNPDLEDLSPLQVMDKLIAYAGVIGLQVILDRHSAKVENYANETLWYLEGEANFTEDSLVSDWVMLAQRYKGTALVGVDLWNEPKHPCTWGSGNRSTDWNLAAERIGNAILAVNPDLLIIVEGVANNTWWGSNLEGVATHPIRLSVPNKVVYSVHEYPNDAASVPGLNLTWFHDPQFPNNLRDRWNKYFGFIVKNNIAPVYIGEFGTSLQDPKDFEWLRLWLRYINGEFSVDGVNDLAADALGMSWSFWAISVGNDCAPGHPGGDCIKKHFGGILQLDWFTVNEYKYDLLRSIEPLPSNSPTAAPPSYTDYLHTAGNQILDKENKPVRITGINWYGFESRGFVPQGLWVRGYKDMIDQMKRYGFNALRIPFCNEMLLNSSRTSTIVFSNNPDLEGKSPLQCLDAIVHYAGTVGMRIILDRHSAKNENYFNETLWYIPDDKYYTEQTLIKDWVMLAKRYRGTTVVGVDLWNEPKHPCTWGSGNRSTDWNLAAERIGNAILAVNPDLLIIVEGIANNTWWGSNLEGVATHPIRLSVPNKVVYSVHEYGDDAFDLTWFSSNYFPNNLRQRWNKYFGYIVKQRIAPVYIGEFGTSLKYPRNSQWLSLWIDYMNGEFTTDGVNDLLPGENGLSWTFWSVSPGGDCTPGHDGGDCIKAHFGGILEWDWRAINHHKMTYLKAAMVPSCVSNYPTMMPSTVRPTSSRPSLAPATSVPSPYPNTLSPTPPPTASVLFYMGSYDFTMISRWNYLNDRTIKYKGFTPSGITPSWLAFSADRRFLYATNEYVSNVQAFSVNPSSGALALINTVPSVGGSPCHITVDPAGRFIAVANYLNGVMTVLAVNATTGALLPSTPDQQVVDSPTSTAHQHCAFIKGQYVTVMEKGQDKISQYPLSSKGLKSNVASVVISTPAGTGPNHIQFHPSGGVAISLNAVGNSLTIIPSDPATGKLLTNNFNFAANTVSTLRAGEDGATMLAAEVAISPNGQFVYASNRDIANPSQRRSSIAVFQLRSTPSPSLQILQHVSSRGDYPRYFQLVRNGTNLVLVNQVDSNFVSFLVNPTTGLIDDSSAVITTPTSPALIQPSCTLFQT